MVPAGSHGYTEIYEYVVEEVSQIGFSCQVLPYECCKIYPTVHSWYHYT